MSGFMNLETLLQHLTTFDPVKDAAAMKMCEAMIAAVENNDIPRMEKLAPLISPAHQLIVQEHIMKHYTKEMQRTVEANRWLGTDTVLELLQGKFAAPSALWVWVLETKGTYDKERVVSWAVQALGEAHEINSTGRLNAQRLLTICQRMENTRDLQQMILTDACLHLRNPIVCTWSEDDWGVFNHYTPHDWTNLFENGFDVDILWGEEQEEFKALNVSLQHIPSLKHALNTWFATLSQEYAQIVKDFAHPQGFEHSASFLQLPQHAQELFLNDLPHSDEEGLYLAILGYTSLEFNIGRFCSYYSAKHLIDVYPHAGTLLCQRVHLSPLHALLARTPEKVLALPLSCGPQIAECLRDGSTLHQFLRGLPEAKLPEVLTMFPDLQHWRDTKGNTLGMWLAVERGLSEQDLNTLFAFPAVLDPNNLNKTVRDILVQDVDTGMIGPETLAGYDQRILRGVLLAHAEQGSQPALRARKM